MGKPSAPSVARWTEGDLVVRVTPELSFLREQSRISVKLYFKAEPRPTKDRLASILVLMEEALNQDSAGLLDVRTGRFYDEKPGRNDLDVFLRAQARAFIHMWNAL